MYNFNNITLLLFHTVDMSHNRYTGGQVLYINSRSETICIFGSEFLGDNQAVCETPFRSVIRYRIAHDSRVGAWPFVT